MCSLMKALQRFKPAVQLAETGIISKQGSA
jgi:hypothetical protein